MFDVKFDRKMEPEIKTTASWFVPGVGKVSALTGSGRITLEMRPRSMDDRRGMSDSRARDLAAALTAAAEWIERGAGA